MWSFIGNEIRHRGHISKPKIILQFSSSPGAIAKAHADPQVWRRYRMQPDTTKKVRHQFPQSDPKLGGASSSPQNSLSPKVASKCSLPPLRLPAGGKEWGRAAGGCVSKWECQSSFFPGLSSPEVQGNRLGHPAPLRLPHSNGTGSQFLHPSVRYSPFPPAS